MVNKKMTSPKVAKLASRQLKSKKSTVSERKVAGSALAQASGSKRGSKRK